MNTFSIEVSKTLKALGVEVETEQWFHEPTTEAAKDFTETFLSNEKGWGEEGDFITFTAYTLHDIFRLMPKIGEKMGWRGGSAGNFEHGYKVEYQYNAHRLLDAFLSGDYTEVEKVLLDLLKEHE